MRRKTVIILLCGVLAISSLSACGSAGEKPAATTAEEMKENDENTDDVEDQAAKEAEEAAAKEAEAEEAYETGRTCLYGLDGQEVDLETAYNSFQKALELGKTEANFYLGVLYDWKGYPELDYKKANAYYEAAGEDANAYISLGFSYYNGLEVEENPEIAKEYFDKAIALGSMDGYLGLAQIARSEEDYAVAMEDYTTAWEAGTEPLYVGMAAQGIGGMYSLGQGVEQDYTKAMEWDEKAYEAGNDNGAYLIGAMYQYGDGVDQDYEKAIEWYEKAYKLGSGGYFAYLIGYIYDSGQEPDYEKAKEWYEKAYESGIADGALKIGYMYYCGLGVEQDVNLAEEWYEKAYESGDYACADTIAEYYYTGQGTEQDYAKALEWYEKAYDFNYEFLQSDECDEWVVDAYRERAVQSANRVAEMYEKGLGVAQDADKAAEWYTKAEEASDSSSDTE